MEAGQSRGDLMSFDVFDPDSDIVPDFCRDVLGMEPTPQETRQDAVLNSNSFLLLVYGLFVGLILGFSLGMLVKTTLLAGG
jgi:hypothetical protein